MMVPHHLIHQSGIFQHKILCAFISIVHLILVIAFDQKLQRGEEIVDIAHFRLQIICSEGLILLRDPVNDMMQADMLRLGMFCRLYGSLHRRRKRIGDTLTDRALIAFPPLRQHRGQEFIQILADHIYTALAHMHRTDKHRHIGAGIQYMFRRDQLTVPLRGIHQCHLHHFFGYFIKHHLLLSFYSDIKGIILRPGQIDGLPLLRFGDIVRIGGYYRLPLLMHLHHQLHGFRLRLVKDMHQDIHHKIHRGKIVIEHHHFIQ